MTINTAPASADLTSPHSYNKAAERQLIKVETRRYLRRGGLIGVYAEGMTHETPHAARQLVHGKNRQTPGDVREYIAALNARIEAKKAARRAAWEARQQSAERRAMAFNTADGRPGPDEGYYPVRFI